MNSRFKFRVWNKLTHSFMTGGAIKFGGLCFVDEEDLGIKLGEHQELYVIEQCTGLKDKNGNLIYEGDIIFDGYCKRIVKWGGWCWHAESKSAICPLDEFTLRESEIIGNIHEQKD